MTSTVTVSDIGRVCIDGERLPAFLTSKEAALLKAILRHKTVATKEALLQELYGGRDEPESKIVDVFVCKVRRKLGDHAAMIETVWGRGFKVADGYAYGGTAAGAMIVEIDAATAKLLVDTAHESDATVNELAGSILKAGLLAHRQRLWAA